MQTEQNPLKWCLLERTTIQFKRYSITARGTITPTDLSMSRCQNLKVRLSQQEANRHEQLIMSHGFQAGTLSLTKHQEVSLKLGAAFLPGESEQRHQTP